MEKTKAIFLDRDGTINYDPGYLGDPDKVEIYPTVIESLKYLKDNFSFKIIVISNQAGIARGLISERDVLAVNSKINKIFSLQGVSIDAFYYCPFHPEFSRSEETRCRKPSPHMILKAAEKFDIDLSKSFMIGDMETDIISGLNAGVKTILIKHNFSDEDISATTSQANFKTNKFTLVKDYIIKNSLR